MSKKFDKSYANKLDEPKRAEIIKPFEILSIMEIGKGLNVADVGAGTGYFSLPLSEFIGNKNIVYAIDVEINMIEIIDKKIAQNNIRNIRTVVSEENDLKIEDNTVDCTFSAFTIHEVENLANFLKELIRITSKNGKIRIVEWKKQISDYGPPIEERLDIELLKQEFNNLGFIEIKEYTINNELVGIGIDF